MPVLSRKAAASTAPRPMPWPLRLLGRWPWLRTLPARAVGIGVQAEHVQSPRA